MATQRKKLSTVLGLTTATIYLLVGFFIVALINIEMREEGLDDARRTAKIVLERSLATHAYFTQQLKPKLFQTLESQSASSDIFDPVLMSSTYAVRWIENYVRKNNPLNVNHTYKSSAVNARSPEYEASPFEVEYLQVVEKQETPEEWSGVKMLNGEPYFIFMKPNIRFDEGCMRCHSSAQNAPQLLTQMYGIERSFGKKAGQISSLISLRIPLAEAYVRANKLSMYLSVIYVILLFFAWAIQNYFLRRFVVVPLNDVRNKAKAIEMDDILLGEPIPLPPSEEMADLASSFNSMSTQLKSHQDDLSILVLERTVELEQVCRDLKASQSQLVQSEKMASIGQLAAGVAHEINNPIGFVKSNLSTLDKYFQKVSDALTAMKHLIDKEGSKELIEEMKAVLRKYKYEQVTEDFPDLIEESVDGINRVSSIVQNLKTFSRVDANEWSRCDLNESLNSALEIVWNELKYKCEVHKDYSELPKVECYPQQISQVFLNLLVNAGHAISDKGDIWLKTWQSEEIAFIAIKDNGTGMDSETKQRLFEPFYTTKEIGKGTGLGMSIVYEIISKHSGSIDIESEHGAGCQVIVGLPINRK